MKEFLVGLSVTLPLLLFLGFMVWLYDKNEEKFKIVVAVILGGLLLTSALILIGGLTWNIGDAILNGVE